MSKADDDLLKAVVVEWCEELIGAVSKKFNEVYEAQPQNARDAAVNTLTKVLAYVCMQLRVPPMSMLDLAEENIIMLVALGPDEVHKSSNLKNKFEIPPALQEEFAKVEAAVLAELETAAEEKPARTLH